MTRERDAFYAERDRRTISYGVAPDPLERPVTLAIGSDAAVSPTGQALALATVNMVARVHRSVALDLPDAPVLVSSLVPATSLAAAASDLALAINPHLQLRHGAATDAPTLAIGQREGTLCVSAHGYQATVGDEPQPIVEHPAGVFGAGLAACLGAAGLLQIVTGQQPVRRVTSLWGFGDECAGEVGPAESLPPLDVGSVAVVGAGTVGSAIAYWLRLIGVAGNWLFVDRDEVELHNTNRSLGLLAEDAGWSGGQPGGAVAFKAASAARLIGADFIDQWYDEWIIDAPRPDLIIPVANDRNVRQLVGQLGLPLLVHGATSSNWTAELHRHGPRDDCPACRFPATSSPQLGCAEGPVDPGRDADPDRDAALPFLSGAAGLLVVAALTQLEAGYLDQRHNQHRLLFQSGIQRSWLNSVKTCNQGCRTRPSHAVRQRLNTTNRWRDIDT